MRRFEIGLGLFVAGSALCGAGFDLRWVWLAACGGGVMLAGILTLASGEEERR